MSVLWCGGEDFDFITYAPPQSTSYIRSGYARVSIHISQQQSGFICRTLPFPAGAVTSCWLSFISNWQVQAGTSWWEGPVIGLCEAASAKGLYFGPYYNSPNNYSLRAFKYDGSSYTTLFNCPAGTFPSFTTVKSDIQIVNFNNASSTIRIYLNGTLVTEQTGVDTTGTGATNLESVGWRLNATAGACFYASEIIVADEDTRAMALVALSPNAAGDANGWTGAYTDIDELTISDVDFVYVNSGDADMQMNLSNVPTASAWRVKAVRSCARALMSADATPNGLALGVKTGGSFDYGTKQNLTVAWASYQRLMLVNPVTTNEWTSAELDALQLNLRAKT